MHFIFCSTNTSAVTALFLIEHNSVETFSLFKKCNIMQNISLHNHNLVRKVKEVLNNECWDAYKSIID